MRISKTKILVCVLWTERLWTDIYYIIASAGDDLFRLLKERHFLLCNGWSIHLSVCSGTGLHHLIIWPPVGTFFCFLVRHEYGTQVQVQGYSWFCDTSHNIGTLEWREVFQHATPTHRNSPSSFVHITTTTLSAATSFRICPSAGSGARLQKIRRCFADHQDRLT
jgi:hypothetical protein